ncbi:MAG: amidohydrolase [Bacteroidetes bacterium]|nr:MAG: amidohydrolase [Bacteroidota bacterium]
MNKRFFIILITFLFAAFINAQDDIYPAPQQKGTFYITNATIHVGTGTVINNGTIKITDGKIAQVGTNISISGGEVFDAKGKQVYPGLILPETDLGLKEIANAVRGSNDYQELGEWNPNVQSAVAYNTDSKIINTLKANGILLANVAPTGSLIAGSSSTVQLDAWNWEDALYKRNTSMEFYMPSLINRRNRFGGGFFGQQQPQIDPVKEGLDKIEEVKKFFREAKAYSQEATHRETNLKFEALKPIFEKKEKLFVHADVVKQLLVAVDFVKEFGIDVVIIGGSESWQIANLLKQNNISVILSREFRLPETEDEDIDQPFKTPYMLKQAGVLFALNDDHDEARYRNLAFNAGQTVPYGLSKEEALQAITLNPAKILGIDDRTGSIEEGKDANIVITEGDILDMRSSIVDAAFIQGRKVSLENKQTQLYNRYMTKYGLK